MRYHKKLISALVVALLFLFNSFSCYAIGEETAIAAGAYAFGAANGAIWSMTAGVNATTAKTWLENEVNSYLATVPQETKDLLADVAIVEGNIVMPSTQYQAYKDLWSWLKPKYEGVNSVFGINGQPLNYDSQSVNLNGWHPQSGPDSSVSTQYYVSGWMKDGNYSGAVANIPLNYVFQGITVAYLPNTVQFFATYVHPTTGAVKQNSPAKQYNSLGVTPNKGQLTANTYNPPAPLPANKAYKMTVDGVSTPTATLPDIETGVFSDVADNSISVAGEVIDVGPQPQPTPAPFPPFPPPPPSGETVGNMDANTAYEWQQALSQGQEAIYDQTNQIGQDIISGQQSIISGQDTIGQGISDLNDQVADQKSIAEQIYSVVSGAINQALNDIKTRIGSLAGSLDDILEELQSLGLTLSEALDAILEGISELVESLENIAEAVIDADKQWFSDLVDSILNPFMPWIQQLASGVSIWHWVVEWLQCIHEPFVLFFGVLTSLGACFPKPIYAVAAASIVIAIYKRFGR